MVQSSSTLHNDEREALNNMERPAEQASNTLVLRGCRGNNLKGVDIAFPLGQMIAVTGVSGSGKSTLINQTLYPILSQYFYRSLRAPLAYDSIEGIEHIDKAETRTKSLSRPH